MFNPKSDRLIYGDLLAPPSGYSLEVAICTTYSLDLETLIASLVALGLNEATDTELLRSPINTLHAIEKVSRKVVVFCEAGQTRIPSNSSALHLLLEKMIVPVALNDPKTKTDYPSFHPKTWIIHYASKEGGKPLYRFIVLSRNLTFDRSWDMASCFEGKEEAGGKKKVKPLLDFLTFLGGTIRSTDPDSKLKQELVGIMASNLERVRFIASSSGKPFRDFDIMPLGIRQASYDIYDEELFDARHGIHDIVVITPFISKGVIKRLEDDSKRLIGSSRRILITRRSELEKLKGALSFTDVFVMKDAVVDGENGLSEEGSVSDRCLQDIHAKAYLSVKGTKVRLLMGSMNASENGLGRNVEMMVGLSTTPSILNKESFLRDLMGEDVDDKMNPFTKVDFDSVPEPEENEDTVRNNELTLKRLCRLGITGSITQDEDGFYRVTLACKSTSIPEGIIVSPLRAKGLSCPFANTVVFSRLNLLQLSEFYSVTVGEGNDKIERLILVPTKGLPKDRDKEIISSIISDWPKFADYVAFVLGDSSEQILSEIMESEEACSQSSNRRTTQPVTALYERMLRTACDDPERLKDIERIMKLIDNEEIVKPGFKRMYKTFMTALKIKYDG